MTTDAQKRANKKWREKHGAEYNRKYYKEHRDKLLLADKRYRDTERYKGVEKSRRTKHRVRLIQMLGGKCSACGFDDYRALQIDHVFSDGAKHRAKFKGQNKSYYKDIEKSINAGEGKYQVLCANCNWIKKYEMNENARGHNGI